MSTLAPVSPVPLRPIGSAAQQKIGYPNFFKKVIRWYTPKFQTKPFCLLKSKGLFVLDGSSPMKLLINDDQSPQSESHQFSGTGCRKKGFVA